MSRSTAQQHRKEVAAAINNADTPHVTAFISHTTIDCANAFALSSWWKSVLGYADIKDDPNEPGDEQCTIGDPATGHQLLFIQVPDAAEVKQRCGKNRLHFDLRPRVTASIREPKGERVTEA